MHAHETMPLLMLVCPNCKIPLSLFQFKNSWHDFIYSNWFQIEMCYFFLLYHSTTYSYHIMCEEGEWIVHFIAFFSENEEGDEIWSEEIIIINKFLHLQSILTLFLPYDAMLCFMHGQQQWVRALWSTIGYKKFWSRSTKRCVECESKNMLLKVFGMKWWKFPCQCLHTWLINRRIM